MKKTKCPKCRQDYLNHEAKIEGKPAVYCEICGYLAFASPKKKK